MRLRFPGGFEPKVVLYLGAEAEIWLGKWMGLTVVAKIRKSKGYRLGELDQRMIQYRTIKEASLMHEAKFAGINTPFIYHVNPMLGAIIMSYERGITLKEFLLTRSNSIMKKVGEKIGKLHLAGISHGDLTPSNMIICEHDVVFLDFGLGEKTSELEKFAEDLNVFKRSLDSMFGPNSVSYWEQFKEGYVEFEGSNAVPVLKRLEEIWSRGRYRRRHPNA